VTKLDRLARRSVPDARAIADPRPKLNARQEAHMVALIAGGQHSRAEVTDLFGVSRPTVYRALQRSRSATTT